jgi:hypothetical protein
MQRNLLALKILNGSLKKLGPTYRNRREVTMKKVMKTDLVEKEISQAT